MRLHRLDMQAFLAFGGRESVDFDALSGSGLFLLQGPTGAGKSSILDAICFALYNTVPGGHRSLDALRSDHADPELSTEVTLELTVGVRRLRVTRSPKQERAKLRGEGTTTQAHQVRLVELLPDGDTREISTNQQEVGTELNRLLGMTSDQFCQVVVLPQGRFEKVLLADSSEREALLRGLFDVNRFTAVEQWLKAEASSAAAEADAAVGLAREAIVLAANICETDQPELDPADPEASRWLSALRSAAEFEHADRRLAHDEAQKSALGTRTAREAAQAQFELFCEAERLDQTAKLALAAAGSAGIAVDGLDGAALRSEAATLREQAGAARTLIAQEEQLKSALAAAGEQLALAERSRTEAAEHLAARDKALAAVPKAESALLAAHKSAARIDSLTQAVEQASVRVSAGERRDALTTSVATARDERLGLAEDAAQAQSEHLRLMELHLDGIAARLATQLTDGEPCAVCGSAEHPAPAAPPEGEDCSEAAVEAARELAGLRAERHEAAQLKLAELRSELAAATATAGDQDLDSLRSAADAARVELDTAASAATAEPALAEVLSSVKAAAELADRTRTEVEQQAAVAEAAATEQAARSEQLSAEVAAGRGEHESVAARVQELSDRAQAVEAAADALEASAKAAERLPKDFAQPELDELIRSEKTAAEEADTAVQALALAEQKATTLKKASERHAKALVAAGPLLERRALTRSLFELVDGISADNRLRMKLSAYVLAAKLDAVAKAATARLLQMSSGRYSLTHRAERGRSNKRGGLELRVIDSHTGEEREARSLSGGEKFYASLALALGLADVITAEAGGSRLDTLFIDEGFGSLDESTLDDVLGVLDTLRSGGRVVGVVSHVRELRERIGAQLQITKSIEGSTLRQNSPAGGPVIMPAPPTLREELERAVPEAQTTGDEPATPAALF